MRTNRPLRIAFVNNENETFEFIDDQGCEQSLPEGFDWAQKALDDLNRGIRRLETCEVDVFGKKRLLEILRQEGVSLRIYQPEKKRPRDSQNPNEVAVSVPQRADVMTTPSNEAAIGINAACLADAPGAPVSESGRNGAFTLGYGIGKFLDTEQMHSLNPMFDMAVRMDNILVHHDEHDVPPTSLTHLLRSKKISISHLVRSPIRRRKHWPECWAP